MSSSQHPDPTVWHVAEALCGGAVSVIEPVQAGGNNKLFRVVGADGKSYALKSYLVDDSDRRDRLHVEQTAFAFLRAHGIEAVPAVIAVDAEKGFALYQWIHGAAISKPADDDIKAALSFIENLKKQNAAARGENLPEASEACLSGAELARQLDARCAALQGVATKGTQLSGFLGQAFAPTLIAAKARAQDGYSQAGVDFALDIGLDLRTLSPSDFGFHNALRTADGDIVFVDFEYFGWDDPVKITADFLLHPAMALSSAHKSRFSEGAGIIFADDNFYAERLRLLFPLYGLRWCLIILNEFLDEKWSRRRFAESELTQGQAKQRQLKKAYTMINAVKAGLEKEKK